MKERPTTASSLWDTYDLIVTPEGASYNFTEYWGENLCSVLSNGWNVNFIVKAGDGRARRGRWTQ